MSIERDWTEDPDYLNYQAAVLAEIREETEAHDPLEQVTYIKFTSNRAWGKPRRFPVTVELIQVKDGRMVAVMEDSAYYLDDLAAGIPGYEDDPNGLLEDLRRRHSH